MMPARWGVFFMLPRFILNSAAPRSEAEDSNKRKAYPVSPKTGSAKTCPLNQRRPTGRRHGQHNPADAGLDDPARAPRAGHLAPVAAGVGDLARQLSSTALRSPARAMMISVAHDLFEKVLRAQRQVVDELVATQRQLVQQFLTTITAIIGGDPARW